MLDALTRVFDASHTWLFESVVQPLLFSVGGMRYQEDAYAGTEWLLLGVAQIALLYIVLRPLEARFPAERWNDRRGVGTDVMYTFLHRLGAFSLFVFLLLTPLVDSAAELLHEAGIPRPNLDQIWPGVTDRPLTSFLLYLVVLDFLEYWLHRAQHSLRWWWALHALHHSQRKMSFWADDRNHLLDDLLLDAIRAFAALAIGVEPGQFVGLVIASRVLQSLQHANLGWTFGWLGKLLVSPIFHRTHHAIGVGHEGRFRGCNFGVLFPWWDALFGTADWGRETQPTGIRDQLPAPQGERRDYGEGFWMQQWLGLKRLAEAIRS
jgi:sterol desaturase/sphingolipid hydroxylase (fatty acid hydroxylase superfamily)